MTMNTRRMQKASCILICGNIQYFDTSNLDRISESYRLVLAGKEAEDKRRNRSVKHFKAEPTEDRFTQLLSIYSPDIVWYFSGYIDGGEGFLDEDRQINALADKCMAAKIAKLVVISSVCSLNEPFADSRDLRCRQFEDLLRFATRAAAFKTILLHVPYLEDGLNQNNYLAGLFTSLEKKQDILLPFHQQEKIDILSMTDLTTLLLSIAEENMDESGEYVISSGAGYRVKELASALKKLSPAVTIDYLDRDNRVSERICSTTHTARAMYGFAPHIDVIGELSSLYEAHPRSRTRKDAVRELVSKATTHLSGNFPLILEILVLFLLMQFLLRYTSDTVYFRYVDLRLFFVVIIASIHGMKAGLAAGSLVAVSLIYSYTQIGVSTITLFYNLDYWFPFAIYLMTGAILGYMKSSVDEKLQFVRDEHRILLGKYLFLNKLYMQSIDNKDAYKRQILGYQDSFGKVFEAVNMLSSNDPDEICANSVTAMERILDNHSIAVYHIDQKHQHAILTACSPASADDRSQSIALTQLQPLLDRVTEGDIWKNTDFLPDLPMYCSAVSIGHRPVLLIMIYEADNAQLGLYYLNLFTILSNLVDVSYQRALQCSHPTRTWSEMHDHLEPKTAAPPCEQPIRIKTGSL